MKAKTISVSFVLLAAFVAAAGIVNAHTPQGTPHDFCDFVTPGGAEVHDYGPPALGFLIFNPTDGNIQGDCDNDPTTVADFDGHYDWAQGGGWLHVWDDPNGRDWNGGTGLGNIHGDGSTICWGVTDDHQEAQPIYVQDQLYGGAVEVTVTSDWAAFVDGSGDPALEDPCGDDFVNPCTGAQTDIPDVTCNPRDNSTTVGPEYDAKYNTVPVPFLGGADGTYAVFVGSIIQPGTLGHITQDSSFLDAKAKKNEANPIPLSGTVTIGNAADPTAPGERLITVFPNFAGGIRCTSTFDNSTGYAVVTVECGSGKLDFYCQEVHVAATAPMSPPGTVSGEVYCDDGSNWDDPHTWITAPPNPIVLNPPGPANPSIDEAGFPAPAGPVDDGPPAVVQKWTCIATFSPEATPGTVTCNFLGFSSGADNTPLW